MKSDKPKHSLIRLPDPVYDFGLTNDEFRFCERYLTHGNPRRANREAFGGKDQDRNLRAILSNPKVHQYIQARQEQINKRHKFSAEWTNMELDKIMRFRNRNLFDEEGNRIPMHMLDDDTDAAISSFDIEETLKEDKVVGRKIKIRTYSKTEAGALISRINGTLDGQGSSGKDRLHELEEVFNSGPVSRKQLKE